MDHQPDARCLRVALSRHPKLHFVSSGFAASSRNSTLDVAFAFGRHRTGGGRRVSFSSLSDGRRAARDSASESFHDFRRVGSLDFFGESLSLIEIVGIALTLGGIIWVILEQGNSKSQALRPSALGILCGVLAAIGQATGLVFSKQGMLDNFSPISGNVIRMLAAVIALWLITFMQREAGKTIQTLKENPSGLQLLALAALIGPVIGVSLSLLAVQNTAVGIASVLTSLSPIFMLPISHFYFKEHLGWQAIAGTILAMIGVAILFLV